MKANELRIGNYAYDCFTSKIVTKIELDDFDVISNYTRSNHPNPYKPIPLTKELFLKLGFKSTDNDYSSINTDIGEIEILWQGVDYKVYLNDIVITYIKYVHQLQNLYFALTGNELEFN